MRKALLLVVIVLAAAAATVALAQTTRLVTIKPAGFDPATVTIRTGDTIRWRNDDRVNHQVVADNGHFASPVLRPGQSWTRLFTVSGTYRYRDALEPAERGTVRVLGPPPSVSIASTMGAVFYGAQIRLTGVISPAAANQIVEIWEKPFGQTSFVKVADVRTASTGAYDYATTPALLTEYQARWGRRLSAVVAVGVRPRITFIARPASTFIVSARARTSMARRVVYVQRKSRFNQWVNIRKVVLGTTGARRFTLSLPRGLHALRIFMTTNQAGTGYLWSHSRTLVVRKR